MRHFNTSYTNARTHLKDLLDAAEKGRVATVRRDARTTAFVDRERLRYFLAAVRPSRAQVVAEDWQERLLDAPNHAGNWGLVQLVSFSDDDQLRDGLVGSGG
jgi:hypothetical protein